MNVLFVVVVLSVAMLCATTSSFVVGQYESVPAVNPKVVTLMAGSDEFPGNLVGSATVARFQGISSMVQLVAGPDSGEYIVATQDQDGSIFRRISSTTVHHVAVSGSSLQGGIFSAMTITNPGNQIFLAKSNQLCQLDATTMVEVSTFAVGNNQSAGSADGLGDEAYFRGPKALAISDDQTRLIVADTGNGCIRSVVIGGTGTIGQVTTVAGKCGYPGYTDSSTDGLAARFSDPTSLVAVGADLFYVSDQLGRIRRLTSSSSWATHTVGVSLAGYGGPLVYDALSSPPALYMVSYSGVWAVGNLTDDSSTYLEWYSTTISSHDSTVSFSIALPAAATAGIITAASYTGVFSIDMAGTTGTWAPAPTNEYPTSVDCITTIVAGTGFEGNTVGSGDVAQFREAKGLAQLPNGDLVLCDRDNHELRRLSAGVAWSSSVSSTEVIVSTLTVTSDFGFQSPVSVLVESMTYLFVVDTDHVAAFDLVSGTVSLIAGNTSWGNLDGPTNGKEARFHGPSELVRFGSPLIVSDTSNYCLRSIATATAANGVQSVAGSCGDIGKADGATGDLARFQNPVGLAVDSRSTSWLYVADAGIIRKVSTGFAVSTVSTLSNSYTTLLSWTADSPDTLLCYSGGMLSRLNLTAEPQYSREYISSVPEGSSQDNQHLVGYGGMLATGVNHEVFLVLADRLLRVDTATIVTPIPSANTPPPTPRPTTTTTKYSPSGASTYLTYTNLAGTDFTGYGDGTGAQARFGIVHIFARDPGTGIIYLYDSGRRSMCTVSSSGVVVTLDTTVSPSITALVFNVDGTASHALSFSGNIYSFNTTDFTLLAGNSTAGFRNEPGSYAQFSSPYGVAYSSPVSPTADLLVTDTANACIRGVTTAAGEVDTKAGICGEQGTADGGATTTARFFAPTAIAVAGGSLNCIFIVDNAVLRKVLSSTFEVSTIVMFALSQYATVFGGPKQMSWNSFSESLFISQGSSNSFLELTNLTATTGDPYFEYHLIAAASSLGESWAQNVQSVAVRSAKEVDILYSTKLGSVNLDSVVATLPTNPPSDTPSPIFMATISTPQPPPGAAANDLSTPTQSENHSKNLSTALVVIVASVVSALLLAAALLALQVSKARHNRRAAQQRLLSSSTFNMPMEDSEVWLIQEEDGSPSATTTGEESDGSLLTQASVLQPSLLQTPTLEHWRAVG